MHDLSKKTFKLLSDHNLISFKRIKFPDKKILLKVKNNPFFDEEFCLILNK